MTSLAYNGPEFIAGEVQAWLKESGSAPHYIDPGCPWQSGFQESFHGTVHSELLSREVFVSVAEAQARLEAHRRWYNEERPHSTLKYLSPSKFAKQWQQCQMRQIMRQNQEVIEYFMEASSLRFGFLHPLCFIRYASSVMVASGT